MMRDQRLVGLRRWLQGGLAWRAPWRLPAAGTAPQQRVASLSAILLSGRRLAIVYSLLIVWQTVQAVPQPAWPRGISLWVAAALFAVLFLLAARRTSGTLILCAGALAVALQVLDASANAPASLAVFGAIALAGGRLPLVAGGLVSLVIAGGMLAAQAHAVPFASAGALLSQCIGLAFTFIAMASYGRLRQEQRRTAALLDEVLAGRDALVRAAALDARAHLAREVHDVLAHTLSALSIQLESASMVAAQRHSDPVVVSTLDRVTLLAREGLREARRAVSSLRGEALPGPDLLPALAAAFEHDTGTPTSLRVDGAARDLPSEARLTLYRTAQEALTNIRKHAEATAVTICLRYAASEVALQVENQGRPRQVPRHEGGGYGLVGMRERAELLGGRLEAGPEATGYRVSLWIPV